MRIHFIDTSGSIPQADIAAIRKNIRIGDTVVCFDHALHNEQVMRTEDDLGGYMLAGGGGTLLQPILERIEALATFEEAMIAFIYSDMHFADSPPNFLSFDGSVRMVFVPFGQHNEKMLADLTTKLYRSTTRAIDAEPTIFLAEVRQTVTPYMGSSSENSFIRLVKAQSEIEAEHLVEEHFGDSEPYGTARSVYVSLSSMIE
jgi:hypothetical protein